MCNKFSELEVFVNDELKLDIFCVTEHFLLDDMIDNYSIENFEIISHFARSTERRGGSLIMCKIGIPAMNVPNLIDLSVEGLCEIAAVDMQRDHLRVVSVYRPPKGDFQAFLEILEEILDGSVLSALDIIVTGDFNVHFHTSDKKWLALRDLMMSYGFKVTIFDPTRGDRCLDNIFINFDTKRHYNSRVTDPALSDHGAVNINVEILEAADGLRRLHISQPITETGKVRFFHLVEQLEWSFVNNCALNIHEKFERLLAILARALDEAFPTRRNYRTREDTRNYLRWYDGNLRRQREHLRFLDDLRKDFPNDVEILGSYRSFKGAYRRGIVEARRACYRNQIAGSGNRAIVYWDIINEHRSKKVKVAKSHDIDANRLNTFFVNIAGDIKSKLPNVDKNFTDFFTHAPNADPVLFKFSHVTYIQVRDAVKALQSKNSRDHYGINATLINSVLNIVVYPMTKLFNQSIDCGVYPDALKITKVIPIHKKGNADDPNNYRPISLVPVVSKIFEHLLKVQIVQHFESLSLFYSQQYGFRKGTGTCDAIIRMINIIVDGMERGSIVGAHFYDLTKAFDCVSPGRLIAKLRMYNFHSNSCDLLDSYLTNRKQYVCLNGMTSDCGGVVGGVPQGSVLGPVLFLIYVNDMAAAVDGVDLLLFADDAALVGCDSEEGRLADLLGGAQSKLTDWFCASDLSVNNSKTCRMFFTHRQTDFVNLATVRYLGVSFDPTLSWEDHVDCLAKILRRICI